MDNSYNRQPYNQRNGGGGNRGDGGGGGSYHDRDRGYQDRGGDQRQYDRRGPPQQYRGDDRDSGGRGGYRGGGGGGYNNNRDGGGGRGGYRGGRGGGGQYNNGGQYEDRKRRNDNEYDQRPPKRQYEPLPPEPTPEPMPIEFEVEGVVGGGKGVRFFYKEKEPLPLELTAIHCVRIHGMLQYGLPFANAIDLAMFLGKCGEFLKQGANIDDQRGAPIGTNLADVVAKLKTITLGLISNCEILETTGKNLNLLQLPAFARIMEMKVSILPDSSLEIRSIGVKALLDWLHGRNKTKKGLKKLDLTTNSHSFARHFLCLLRQDNADVNYIIRITCPNPPIAPFSIRSGKKSNIQLVKEKDGPGSTSYLLSKYPEDQPEQQKIRDRYPKLPMVCFTDVPKPAPGSK